MLTEKIKYGNRIISYSVLISNRKTLGITVTPDKQVIVRCPNKASREKVNKLIQRKLRWISNKLSYFESMPLKIPARKFISGETHYFLGRQYRLKIVKSPLEDVKLKGPYIFVHTQKGDNKRIVELLLDNWYKERAFKNFNKILNIYFPKFKKYDIHEPKIVIKKMKIRWGSCNVNNRISLNQELIKTPLICIKYVIAHELCHLIHRNHDRAYYKLLSSIFPDWEKTKNTLDKIQYCFNS